MPFAKTCVLVGALALLALGSAPATAATTVQTADRSLGGITPRSVSPRLSTGRLVRSYDFQGPLLPWGVPFTFDQFDPTEGTLNSVDIAFTSVWRNFRLSNTVTCHDSGLNSSCESESLVHTFRVIHSLTLPGGQRISGESDSIGLSAPAALAPYIGTGTIGLVGTYSPQLAPLIICDPNLLTILTRCNGTSTRDWSGGIEISVSYAFAPAPPPPPAPIPLPAGGLLLLAALGALGLGRRF